MIVVDVAAMAAPSTQNSGNSMRPNKIMATTVIATASSVSGSYPLKLSRTQTELVLALTSCPMASMAKAP
jgi:hypothetical protein